MYGKLLSALDGMDLAGGDRAAGSISPNVTELDLYITTTDILGIPLPLRLADKVVYERRHKKVFHFVYSSPEAGDGPRNDFRRAFNPFLAFAARSTSAYPVAFEPETLAEIDEPVPPGTTQGRSGDEAWDTLLKEYLRRDDDAPAAKPSDRAPEALRRRAFGDGGYLDNKPFSYAIDALLRRRADVPLERKLLYIEPAPERAEDEPATPETVDVLQNVRAALLTLPRRETIREDLQRVLQRNQLIERVAHFTSGIEEDLPRRYLRGLPDRPAWNVWGDKDLTQMIEDKGISFGGYHRLKVSSLMDRLAAAMALAGGIDADSDYMLALVHLVNAWRRGEYVRYRDPSDPRRRTENNLLVNLDLDYRLRRLMFVRGKIDALSSLDSVALTLVKTLLVWYRNSIRDGLGDSALVRLRGAAQGLHAAVDLARRTIHSPDRLTLRVLVEEVRRFRESAQGAEEKHHECSQKSRGIPAEILRDGYSELLERRRVTDVYTLDLSAVEAPLTTFRRELESRLLASDEFEEQARTWDVAAARLSQEQWPGAPANRDFQDGFRAEMRSLKKELDKPFAALRELQRDFWDPNSPPIERGGADRRKPFRDLIRAVGVTPDLLAQLLGRATEEERRRAAEELVAQKAAALQAGTDYLADSVRGVTFEAARLCSPLLDPVQPPGNPDAPIATRLGRLVARACARHYYDYYEDYDLVLFPILYQSDVGELARVDIFRVSPEDTRRPSSSPTLAGTTLANFGAFFDAGWRANDILWGRLDGAERLLDVLLPGAENDELRAGLLVEAHEAILREELRPSDQAELSRRLVDALVQASAGRPLDQVLSRVVGELRADTPRNAKLAAVLRLCLEDEALLDYFRNRYEVDRAFEPQKALRLLARSTRILGRMLEGLARRYHVRKPVVSWVARIASLLWGVVEVAVPRSTWYLLTRHVLDLLLLLEVFLLVGGTLLVNREAQQFALIALAATVAFRVGVILLGQYMHGRQRSWAWVRLALIPTLAALAILGIFHGLEMAGHVYSVLDGRIRNVTPLDRVELAAATWAALLCGLLALAGGRAVLAGIRARFRRRASNFDAYVQTISQAVAAENPAKARRLLAQCASHDRRWEWFYLRGQSDGSAARDLRVGGGRAPVLTPDGRYLVGASDGLLAFSRPSTGKPTRAWSPARRWPRPDGPTAVALARDTRAAVAASADQEIFLWSGWDSKPIGLCSNFTAYALQFSSDGRRLLAGGKDGTLCVWARDDGRLLARFPARRPTSVTALAFSPDGRLLAYAKQGERTCVSDLATGLDLSSSRPLPEDASALALDAAGRLALAAGDTLALYDAASGHRLARFGGREAGIRVLAFTPDGKRFASADADGVVKLWDAEGYRRAALLSLVGGRGRPRLCFSEGGTHLVWVGADGQVFVWAAPGFRARSGA
jgi:hypothetical protein